jgi:hypothetical protein
MGKPLGVEVNNPGLLHALFPTNQPNSWESLQFSPWYLVMELQCLTRLGHSACNASRALLLQPKRHFYATNKKLERKKLCATHGAYFACVLGSIG